ncbi:MAG: hypothetical protein V8Q77_03980 [Bacilli bacterium]
MAKLTRNSYKRKIILFGVIVFMSIALISTGFAAWVMSQEKKQSKSGNVTVGAVTEGNIEVILDELTVKDFKFEPKESDTTGRVRNDKTNFESLTVTVTGTIKNTQFLKEATIKMNVKDAVKQAETAGYIILPECANSEVVLTLTESGTNEKKFSYDITFKWGSKFGGENPGEYYDSAAFNPSEGELSSFEGTQEEKITAYIKSVLDAFHALMDTSTYEVVVTAKLN